MLRYVETFQNLTHGRELFTLRGYTFSSFIETSIGTGLGRWGGNAFVLPSDAGRHAYKKFISGLENDSSAGNRKPMCANFSFKCDSAPSGTQPFFAFHNSATSDKNMDSVNYHGGRLSIDSAGKMVVSQSWGSVGSNTDPSQTILCDGLWHHVEVVMNIDNASGFYHVYIDGKLEITYEGDWVVGSTAYATDGFHFHSDVNQSSDILISDLFIYDDVAGTTTGDLTYTSNFPVGDVRIQALTPNAAGTNSAWTALEGSNYTQVDEAGYEYDKSYVYSTASGQTDTYNFTSLSATPGTIVGVAVETGARNLTAGTATYKTVALSSGSTTEGKTHTPDTTYGTQFEFFAQDPSTASAWTEGGVNAAEFGVDSQ